MRQSFLLLLLAVLCLSSIYNPSVYASIEVEESSDEPVAETVIEDASEPEVVPETPVEETAVDEAEDSTPEVVEEEEEEEEEEVVEVVENEEETVVEDEEEVVEETPETESTDESEIVEEEESTDEEGGYPASVTFLKDTVLSKFDIISNKVKDISITQEKMKKIAAFGLGAWGAATGAGWAMQQFGAKKDA